MRSAYRSYSRSKRSFKRVATTPFEDGEEANRARRKRKNTIIPCRRTPPLLNVNNRHHSRTL